MARTTRSPFGDVRQVERMRPVASRRALRTGSAAKISLGARVEQRLDALGDPRTGLGQTLAPGAIAPYADFFDDAAGQVDEGEPSVIQQRVDCRNRARRASWILAASASRSSNRISPVAPRSVALIRVSVGALGDDRGKAQSLVRPLASRRMVTRAT